MVNKRQLLSVAVLNGYTQSALAKTIGIGKNTMCRKLNGYADFTTKEIDAICDVLNITDLSMKAKIFLSGSFPNGNE